MPATDLPILEVYYADNCVPCRQEVPVLGRIAENIRLVVYVLDNADHLPTRPNQTVILTAPADPRTVLRQAGDADGILPYARSVSATGVMCQSWRGIVTVQRAAQMVSACAPPVHPAP